MPDRTAAKAVCFAIVALAACDEPVTRPVEGTVRENREAVNEEVRLGGTSPFLAISLTRLGNRLEECQPRNACTRDDLGFGGMTRLHGYAIDDSGTDVVLFGERESGRPTLAVGDLVVALRNAWLKYASLEGDTYVYSYPSCSIDPDPSVIRQLERLGQRILSGPGAEDGRFEEWRQVCARPQAVRVAGVPFDSRFARIMVQADYDMKSLVDGSDPLPGIGPVSLVERTLAEVRRSVVEKRPLSVPISTMNRFWFYPGENVFAHGARIVLLVRSPVHLLSNTTYVDRQDRLRDATERDPLAESFASDFSLLYDEIASERPIYRDLESLFRFVALAGALKQKVGASPTSGALGYLLEGFVLPTVPVARSLPGRSTLEGFEHHERVPDGVSILTVRLPSCGGVDAAIDVGPEDFHRGPEQPLQDLRSAVLAGAAADAAVWIVRESPGGSLSDFEASLRARRLNRASRESLLVTVVDQKTGYKVFSGGIDPVYVGDDHRALVESVNSLSDSAGASVLYFELRDFPPGGAERFAASCRIQQRRLDPAVGIYELTASGALVEAFFTPRVEVLAGGRRPSRLTDGENAGWYTASFSLSVMVRRAVQVLTFRVVTKTKEILEAFLTRLEVLFPTLSTRAMSAADLVNRLRRELVDEMGIDWQDLRILVEDQPGRSQVVDLHDAHDRRAA